MHKLIIPFGIATYTMLIITVILGLGIMKFRLFRIKLIFHFASAIITVICGTTHLILNLIVMHH